MVGAETALVAVASRYVTVAPDRVPSTLTLAGHTSEGGVVSCTVTVKLQLAALPAASVAVAVTTVSRRPNCDPDAWL